MLTISMDRREKNSVMSLLFPHTERTWPIEKMLTAPNPSQAGEPFHAFLLKSNFGSTIRQNLPTEID